ncbi:MAG: class I SAM-dependent RNA methyltransferase [Chthoniobacterales bacterium]|nr:class I SAM-dependent RNA methyltransferase [Chthoniobacterales bacterium]
MRPVELQIEDVAFGGKGVGRTEGKVVFVPYTIAGERVATRITREKKQFAEAELAAVLEESPERTTPKCPYFGRCGGCSYQHMKYKHQLQVKQKQVENALRRIGRLNTPVQTIVSSPQEYGYRNRITVHADGGRVGYYRRDVHELIDVEHCPIAAPEVNQALTELRSRAPRDGHYTLRARSGPRVFAQTNDGAAEALAQIVERLLPTGHHLLVDAYCGSGFFTKRLAARFERVVGIEWDRLAVATAEQNAGANETYIAGDADLEVNRALAGVDLGTTSAIVDPPATGLSAGTRNALLEHPVHTLVYVSCNPATLARDLAVLQAQFTLLSATPLDMFPQTAEIECVAHLCSKAD